MATLTEDFEHIIRGRLTDDSSAAISGATIQILDLDGNVRWSTDDESVTDSDGWFAIPATRDEVREVLSTSLQAPLMVAACVGRVPVVSTLHTFSPSTFTGRDVIYLTGVASAARTYNNCTYTVSGIFLDADGDPGAGTVVKVFVSTVLGAASTSFQANLLSDGRFLVDYTLSGACDPTAPNTTIQVVVMDAELTAAQLPPICSPRANEVLLVVPEDGNGDSTYYGPSEVEVLRARTSAILDGSLEIRDLTDAQVAEVACRTGFEEPYIGILRDAENQAWVTDSNADVWYALLRSGGLQSALAQFAIDETEFTSIVERAVANNIVPRATLDSLSTLATQFQGLRVQASLTDLATSSDTILKQALVGFGLDLSTEITPFLTSLYANTDTLEVFWSNLRTSLGNGPVDTIQFAYAASSVTLSHGLLNGYLASTKWGTELNGPRDLAKYSEADWLSFLGEDFMGATVGVPAGFSGSNQDFAAYIARRVEQRYPTETVAYQSSSTMASSVADFVGLNPDFSFQRSQLSGSTWTEFQKPGGVNEEDLRVELQKHQRLFQIAPRLNRAKVVNALIDGNVNSAMDVYARGRAGFVAKFGTDLGGTATAIRVYEAAAKKASQNLALYSRFNGAFSAPLFSAVTAPGCGTVDLSTIFGSQDYCACEKCLSVHSAAAYFVELLQWLDGFPADGTDTALDVLLARRPDLEFIDLTCENSQTPLPSIDLVIEQLERAVAVEAGDTTGMISDPQTTWNAEDLRAYPENLDNNVYSAILGQATAVHPWSLPFSLALAEARVYLDHLGARRFEVLEAIAPFPDTTVESGETVPADYDRPAARRNEWLRLSRVQADLATGENSTLPTLEELWGTPNPPSTPTAADFQPVRVFLKHASLTFEQLKTLLYTRWGDELEIDYASDSCSLDDASLEVIGAGSFDVALLRRIHSFLRTSKAVGWSYHQLDAAIAAVSADGFKDPSSQATDNATLLARLADVARMDWRTKVEFEELLTLWGDLNLRAADPDSLSFYERVVQPNAAPSEYGIDSTGGELQGAASSVPFSLNLVSLSGLLRVDVDELSSVFSAASLTPADHVTLRNVSRMYRVASLARMLGLSPTELEKLATWTDTTNVFGDVTSTHFEALDKLFVLKDRMGEYGVSFSDLELAITANADAELAETQRDQASHIAQMVLGLRGVVQEETNRVSDLPEDQSEQARVLLGRLDVYDAEVLESEVVPLIVGTFHTYDDATEDAAIALHLPFITDSEITDILGLAAGARAAGDTEKVIEALKAVLLLRALEDYVTTFVAGLSDLAVADVRLVLQETKWDDGGAPSTEYSALELFTAAEFYEADELDPPDLEVNALADPEVLDVFSAKTNIQLRIEMLGRVQKAMSVANTFDLNDQQLKWVYSTLGGPLGALPLDLRELPTETYTPATDDVQDRMTRWAWMLDAALVRERYVTEPRRIFELVDNAKSSNGTEIADYEALVEEITSFDAATMSALTSGLSPQYDELVAIQRLVEVGAAAAVARRLGVDAAVLRRWGQGFEFVSSTLVEVSAATAAEMRGSAQAKHGPTRWPDIAQPIRDQLRTRQRDVLVDWLLARIDGLDEPDDLLGRYLLDTQTSPCTTTSRIVDAISAVQLFVSRVLMNLEPDVTLDEDAGREWVWMSRYRVWEANRKVFLWPENWLAPELRRDKTPEFLELEERLGQVDLTEAVVEEAYKAYIEQMTTLGRLHVIGMHVERDDEDGLVTREILHVFARAQGAPGTVYYRRRVADSYWTPWEALPFEIEVQDVLPVIANRRLYLFWPKTAIKQGERNSTTQKKDPVKRLEVRLCYAEYSEGVWRGPKTSHSTLLTSASTPATWVYPDLKLPMDLGDRKYQGLGLLAAPAVDGSGIEIIAGALALSSLPEEGQPPEVTDFRVLGAFQWDGCSDDMTVRFGDDNGARVALYWGWNEQSAAVGSIPRYQGFQRLNLEEEDAEDANRGYLTLRGRHQGVSSRTVRQGPDTIRYPKEWEVHGKRQVESDREFLGFYPFIYQNDKHAFLAVPKGGFTEIDSWTESKPGTQDLAHDGETWPADPELGEATGPSSNTFVWPNRGYQFTPLFHPYVCEMMSALRRGGVPALLDPPSDTDGEASLLRYQAANEALFDPMDPDMYAPRSGVEEPYPRAKFDFSFGSAYGIYNWEIFVYAPLYIAERLIEQEQYAEARKWLHYIFDPTQAELISQGEQGSGGGCRNLWKVKPLREEAATETVEDLLSALAYDGGNPSLIEKRQEVEAEIEFWRDHPFDPHAISRTRPQAIQRYVVMKYLDLLIAWGDSLFRQDTIETNNEATQLYVLAKQLLGPRPEEVPGKSLEAKSYSEVRGSSDAFSNAMVLIENAEPHTPGGLKLSKSQPALQSTGSYWLPPVQVASFQQLSVDQSGTSTPYFCVPPNEKMLGYWDTVDDRLFKLRNCLNIEGVFRQLPLFQPPIDPALLIKALAQGVDLASAIRGISAPVPPYRFTYMLGVAKDFAAQVQQLGGSVLSALEKRDAEELARLRVGQQVRLVEFIKKIREDQIDEARQQIEVLRASLSTAQERLAYYQSRPRVSAREKQSLDEGKKATGYELAASSMTAAAGAVRLVPKIEAGIAGLGPYSSAELVSGEKLADGLTLAASVAGIAATAARAKSSQTALLASWDRRKEDWVFQAEQAEAQIEEIERQITAAEIRVALAVRELDSQQIQIENANEEEEYLRSKFTNRELYNWMEGQLGSLYKSAFGLAVDMAKRAERSYQFEIGNPGASFVTAGHWDSRREGLLAGERLSQELRRMEVAYNDNNRREFELTKRVSLATINPEALEQLKTSGFASFGVPEWLFDIDHPTHYFRRLRMVSVTVPSVTGPFDTIGATVSYLSGKIRREPADADPTADYQSTIESIALSTGQEDTGLFEPSFSDPRYLPFEYKGASDSQWSVRLPSSVRAFDYRTISDVVLNLRYTARGSSVSRESSLVQNELDSGILFHAVSLRAQYPTQWAALLDSLDGSATGSTTLSLGLDDFPNRVVDNPMIVSTPGVFLWTKEPESLGTPAAHVTAPGEGQAEDISLTEPSNSDGRLWSGIASPPAVETAVTSTPGTWLLEFSGLPTSAVDYYDVILLFAYRLEAPSP